MLLIALLDIKILFHN